MNASHRVTRKDVAQLAGVSGTVVSDVLNRRPKARVSADTRARVIEAARKLKYRPHGIARRLVTGNTLTISLAVYDLETIKYEPWSRLFLGISKAADARRYNVDLAVTSSIYPGQAHFHYQNKIDEKMTDGFIVYDSRIEDLELHQITEAGYPVVLIDRQIDSARIPSVCNDYAHSMNQAVHHLYEKGYPNWAFIVFEGMGPSFYNYTEMMQALRQLWEQRNSGEPLRVLYLPAQEDVDITSHVADFLARYPETTAMLCWTDGAAARINLALRRLGRAVPEQMALIGCNNEHLASLLYPPLSSIDIQREQMGEAAANLLLDMIDGRTDFPSNTLVRSDLIPRDSVLCRQTQEQH
jgi:LacI family transcriptional regulator